MKTNKYFVAAAICNGIAAFTFAFTATMLRAHLHIRQMEQKAGRS